MGFRPSFYKINISKLSSLKSTQSPAISHSYFLLSSQWGSPLTIADCKVVQIQSLPTTTPQSTGSFPGMLTLEDASGGFPGGSEAKESALANAGAAGVTVQSLG